MSGTKIVGKRVKNFENIKRRFAELLSHIYVPTNNDMSYKSILTYSFTDSLLTLIIRYIRYKRLLKFLAFSLFNSIISQNIKVITFIVS